MMIQSDVSNVLMMLWLKTIVLLDNDAGGEVMQKDIAQDEVKPL